MYWHGNGGLPRGSGSVTARSKKKEREVIERAQPEEKKVLLASS